MYFGHEQFSGSNDGAGRVRKPMMAKAHLKKIPSRLNTARLRCSFYRMLMLTFRFHHQTLKFAHGIEPTPPAQQVESLPTAPIGQIGVDNGQLCYKRVLRDCRQYFERML
ncbi:hypothetical protein EVAR_69525_1 [Eumeta japonica]|uniref:Uncharacterized protein n=1 Tax=Eumeta variegata TaxID=151549 RepID=A0A4C2A2Z6_EUMVA|nr:hypothetical protein EVAR_69525_1 [Eumeta japonica]